MMKTVLTIAGSDSGGGAGIQADLKTITVLKAFGTSAITALTAQNTLGVSGIHEIPPEFVASQIDAVLTDIGADAVKTGMLANEAVVSVVAQKMRQYDVRKLVVDPVMVAKSGDSLLSVGARAALRDELLGCAHVVTPNIPEASILADIEVDSLEQMMDAARLIHDSGARHVLVKGGHLQGDEALDLLFDGTSYTAYEAKRVQTQNTHGTGCTYAAAIATFLAQGLTVHEAVLRAKQFVTVAIQYALELGGGRGPTNHQAFLEHPLADVEVHAVGEPIGP